MSPTDTGSGTIVDRFSRCIGGCFDGDLSVFLSSLPSSAAACLSWALRKECGGPVVLITEGPHSLQAAHQDLNTLFPCSADNSKDSAGTPPLLYFPPGESLPGHEKNRDPEITGSRMDVLLRLAPEPQSAPARKHPSVIATCVQALMQKTLDPSELNRIALSLSLETKVEMEDVVDRMTHLGYDAVPEVQNKGEVSVKGGLVDVWPTTEVWPLRIEFLGSVVESIRAFNPADQKSIRKTNIALIPPVLEERDTSGTGRTNRFGLLAHLPSKSILIWLDLPSIRDHADAFRESLGAGGDSAVVSFQSLRSCAKKKGLRQVFIGNEHRRQQEFSLGIRAIDKPVVLKREVLQPDTSEESRQRILSDLRARAEKGQRVFLFFDTRGALDHYVQNAIRDKHAVEGPGGIEAQVGILSEGFVADGMKMVVVAESDIRGVQKRLGRRYNPLSTLPRPRKNVGKRIAEMTDMEPDDLVIHTEHGLGKYRGLSDIHFNGRRQEVVTIEYADNALLHVPTYHAHLLSRYVGVSHRVPRLHRLGGKRWSREKLAVETAIMDMASSLLETQARRNVLKGHAFAADTPWQREFENSFPYRETPDQETVIADVKKNMESARPMDRLVCGDAGYGKTEVALRAAFKTVMNGRQVAVLVPTTLLAQQHFETFSERLSPYPFRVEMLSRFCSRSRRQDIMKGMANGTVDIVIGTHALVQPDIRFRNLGLAVIDEGQRFGVAHKEQLKQIRSLVDVLTLTATPIPRTLYMSMTGARDMSLLQTPPSERMAIQTIVARNSDHVVREAILREINREGQVFYLHNRVMTIDRVREHLAQIVPEARIVTAHGQMPSAQLKVVMHNFVAGEFDLLLCTTIIESGMDIPRANTILIDRADRFGIADLYQLRGRVGRSSHKAYAYLLLPPHGRVDSDARKRIAAVQKFSSLSAGFDLALRDLEIRGAGNMLGAEQSGHITTVGFGLYCQLLQRTIARLKGEEPPPIVDVEVRLDFVDLSPSDGQADRVAIIPYDYIDDESIRIAIYRKLAETTAEADISMLRDELKDRFGPLPPAVRRLLRIAELRILAAGNDIGRMETRNDKIMLMRNGEYLMKGTRFPRLTGASADAKLEEIAQTLRDASLRHPPKGKEL